MAGSTEDVGDLVLALPLHSLDTYILILSAQDSAAVSSWRMIST